MQATPIVDCHCRLGEGPLWHPEERVVYWTDIETGKVYRYDPETRATDIIFDGDKVAGLTLQEDGSLLLFMNKGAIRTLKGGEIETLQEEIPDERTTRFNDVIAAPDGGALCGFFPTADRLGRLYRLNTDASYSILLEGIGCSNGLAFTEDDTKLYYTDSTVGEIYLFDYDPNTGAMSNQRVFWKTPDPGSVPDGLTVDAEGHVWTAQYGGECVIRLRPDGTEDGRLLVPGAKAATSLTFGGDDLTDMYITTACQDYDGEHAGNLYHARPGVAGVPEYRTNIRKPDL